MTVVGHRLALILALFFAAGCGDTSPKILSITPTTLALEGPQTLTLETSGCAQRFDLNRASLLSDLRLSIWINDHAVNASVRRTGDESFEATITDTLHPGALSIALDLGDGRRAEFIGSLTALESQADAGDVSMIEERGDSAVMPVDALNHADSTIDSDAALADVGVDGLSPSDARDVIVEIDVSDVSMVTIDVVDARDAMDVTSPNDATDVIAVDAVPVVTCQDSVACSCPAHSTCELQCAALLSCSATCSGGSTCSPIDCSNTTNCSVACSGHAQCPSVNCHGSAACVTSCSGGATCGVDCAGATVCTNDCSGGAACIVHCDDSAVCQFTSCSGGSGALSCPNNFVTCNRACPTCGDGLCEPLAGESCSSCPGDCSECP